MKFCDKCGKTMKPKGKGIWVCPSCGNKEKGEGKTKLGGEKRKETEDIKVFENQVSGYPTTERECPKCGNKKAYYQVIQTRSSDEPPTRFYRCTKCGKKWREYK